MSRPGRFLLTGLLIIGSGCATSRTGGAPSAVRVATDLEATIERLSDTAPFDRAIWGILVEDESGRILYEKNGRALMMPASNRKLFSAAVDANCLGLDTRLRTELWIEGDDVVVRGDGDPSFGASRHESGGLTPFVDAIVREGRTTVRTLVVDVSRFDRITIPPSWKVGNLPDGYSAPVDAVAFNENVSGEYSVADPAIFTASRFRDALALAGISVGGLEVRTVPKPCTLETDCRVVAAVESPAIAELLRTVLKNSHNLYAEMLFKRSASAGSYAQARELELQFARDEVGADLSELSFADGSGLSPENLVTPAALVKLLRWMNEPGRRSTWWALLARPAGEGTLRNRLRPFDARIAGKTGTINGVNALSAIVRSEDGRSHRYFSIMLNHHTGTSAEALRVIDAMVAAIAEF